MRLASGHRRARYALRAQAGATRCYRGRAHAEEPHTRRCAVCNTPAEAWLLASHPAYGSPSAAEMVESINKGMRGVAEAAKQMKAAADEGAYIMGGLARAMKPPEAFIYRTVT